MKSAFLFFTTLLIITVVVIGTSASHQDKPQQRKMVMVGGYTDITDSEDDFSRERLRTCAEFVYSHFTTNSPNTLEGTDAMQYSFVNNASFGGYKILQASQQVVAGMNYRMIMMLNDGTTDACVGAFGVTVYDRFGELKIKDWGNELSCDEANALSADNTMKSEILSKVFNIRKK